MAEVDYKISELNELTTVADEDLLAIVDDPAGMGETKYINREKLLGSKIISTDLGMASKTAGAALPIQKNNIIANDVQLTGSTADGFPNTTTLYIWNFDSTSSESQTDIIGSKALAVAAGALTAGNDVLGNSKYCAFDGSTYLSSADAAFNFTGDFSISCWIYLSSYSTIPASYVPFSRYSSDGGDNGWQAYFSTNETFEFATYSANATTSNVRTSVAGLSAGWHHFCVVRDADVGTSIFVDGVLVANIGDASQVITAAGNLEVGSSNGGNSKLTGRIDELFVHKDTILTADEVRNIYARSAKKFAVKAQDGTVSITGNAIQNIPYETGTYTPVVTASGGTGNTIPVYAVNSGSYTRIGNKCFVTVQLSGDGGAEGAGTGTITVSTPMPISSSHTRQRVPAGSATNSTTFYQLYCDTNPSTSLCYLFYFSSASEIADFTLAMQNNATRNIYLNFEITV